MLSKKQKASLPPRTRHHRRNATQEKKNKKQRTEKKRMVKQSCKEKCERKRRRRDSILIMRKFPRDPCTTIERRIPYRRSSRVAISKRQKGKAITNSLTRVLLSFRASWVSCTVCSSCCCCGKRWLCALHLMLVYWNRLGLLSWFFSFHKLLYGLHVSLHWLHTASALRGNGCFPAL